MKTRSWLGTVSAAALVGFALQFGGSAQAEAAPPAEAGPGSGELFLTVQWCDTQEAMKQVVDRHAEAGEAAADAVWDALSSSGVCHTLDADMPAIATLIEATHKTVVTMSDPMGDDGAGRPVILEVWMAAIEGIADRPVYIARGAMLPGGAVT